MIQEHPRAAEAHDGADFLTHVGTVAVHRAFVALGLGVAELAMVQTRQGIFQQLPALSAQARASVPNLTFMASLPAVASLAASAVAHAAMSHLTAQTLVTRALAASAVTSLVTTAVAPLAASALAHLAASSAAHFAASLPSVVLTAPQFDHVADCSFLPIDTIHCHYILLVI